jgi:hypothetical protein
MKRKIFYYEYNGTVQASFVKLSDFVLEDSTVVVGVGCDKSEAKAELLVKV